MKENFRIGKLLTLKKVRCLSKKMKLQAQWLCKCDCGKEIIVNQSQLYGRGSTSCGCHDYKNKKLVGKENYNEIIKEKIKKYTVVDDNNCWIWQGSKHRQGYGNLNYKRIPSLAHRVSWMVHKGDIPEGVKVCHKCDITSCVNPDHLFLGTQKENVSDAIQKGKYSNRLIGKRRNKLNHEQVQEIKKLHCDGINRKDLEIKFSVSKTCIAKILTNRSWNVNWTQEL